MWYVPQKQKRKKKNLNNFITLYYVTDTTEECYAPLFVAQVGKFLSHIPKT